MIAHGVYGLNLCVKISFKSKGFVPRRLAEVILLILTSRSQAHLHEDLLRSSRHAARGCGSYPDRIVVTANEETHRSKGNRNDGDEKDFPFISDPIFLDLNNAN